MAKKRLNILIVGSGSLGSGLAKSLSDSEHNITVLDVNENAFRRLRNDFGGTLKVGDATSVDTLIRAGISKCDVVAAATSNDNINIFVALVAKEIYKVKKVIARVYDDGRVRAYGDLQIETICPSTLAANALKTSLDRLTEEMLAPKTVEDAQ